MVRLRAEQQGCTRVLSEGAHLRGRPSRHRGCPGRGRRGNRCTIFSSRRRHTRYWRDWSSDVCSSDLGVTGVAVGDPVAVYGPWGCGLCHACARGAENYCPRAASLGIAPPGLGAPGALAEYMIVDDVRHLVPLGDLDPVQSVSLTDAGLTPYHAIVSSLDALPAGSTAVVIGAGGLGHVGIQVLRAITGATVVALDVTDEKLALASQVGAHHVRSEEHTSELQSRQYLVCR